MGLKLGYTSCNRLYLYFSIIIIHITTQLFTQLYVKFLILPTCGKHVQDCVNIHKHLNSSRFIWWGPCCSSFQYFVLPCYTSLCSEFSVVMSARISEYKRCSVRLYFKLFVVLEFMSDLRYLCLFAYSCVQHLLCCVFLLFVFLLYLVYPMMPVSLDSSFLIACSISSNVYSLTGEAV